MAENNFETAQQPDSPVQETNQTLQGEYRKEDWARDLRRLIRRNYIDQLLRTNFLDDTKRLVRKLEKDNQVDALIEDLTTVDTLVYPKMAELSNEISETVMREFPQVEGIVLLGSSVHGGAFIRAVTLHEQIEHDFDWATIELDALTDDQRLEVIRLANHSINISRRKYGLNLGFASCDYVNPRNFNLESLHTVDEAMHLLELFPTGDIMFPAEQLLLYYYPSFPPEVNERNRSLLNQALKELSKTDLQLWQRIVGELIDQWKRIHNIEDLKYMKIANKPRDSRLRERVRKSSSTFMSQPLAEELRQTKEEN